MTGSAIRLSKIAKRFGENPVLRDVDLAVEPGEFMTLVGPSGCGKSTLLKMVAGLDQPDDGMIEIGGRAVNHVRPSQRDIAMVFQNYALYPHMRVRENLAMPLIMAHLHFAARMPLIGGLVPGTRAVRRHIAATVGDVARSLEISALLDRKPSELSGGQRQRVALGRAMVRRPSVFLMDEPLSNLDASLRMQVRTELVDLQRRLEATFLYVTHDQVEAMTMSGRIAVMMEGEIIQIATPAEIYSAPVDIRVARFIGSPTINILPARAVAAGGVTLFGERVAMRTCLTAEQDMSLGIRPEDIQIGPRQAECKRSCHYEARLHLVENLGNEVIIHLVLAGEGALPLVARMPQREWAAFMARGCDTDHLPVNLPLQHVLIFDGAGRLVRPAETGDVKRLEVVS
ncbi:ABC transporter ATP-binding protein [Rhizobium sp. LEGMi135b]